MLDREHTHSAFRADNRNSSEAVEPFFTRFGNIAEIGVRRCLIKVQCFDILGDCPDKTFAQSQACDVYSGLIQPARGKQFKSAVAQKVNGTNLA